METGLSLPQTSVSARVRVRHTGSRMVVFFAYDHGYSLLSSRDAAQHEGPPGIHTIPRHMYCVSRFIVVIVVFDIYAVRSLFGN